MSEIKVLNDLLKNSKYSVFDWEDMFLGAIISGKTDGDELIKAKSAWFFQKETQNVFEILSRLKLESHFDYISVYNELSKFAGATNAKTYLEKIIAKVPEEYNPNVALELLEQSYVGREAGKLLADAQKLVSQSPLSAPEIIYSVYESIDRLVNTTSNFNWKEYLNEVIQGLNDGSGPRLVIPTGIKGFDSVAGGISTQEITVIAGRPGHGKTTSVISLSRSILDHNPEAVVSVYELEMSSISLMHKYIASEARIDHLRMRNSKLMDDEKQKLEQAKITLSKYENRLFIYDNIYDLATMNKLNRATNTTVAVVDFITLMNGMTEMYMRVELGRILINAKRYAKAHNMAYIFYSQLNRSVEARDTKRPMTSDLSESDMISQLAGDIILLFYAFKYTGIPNDKNKIKLIFDKTRYSAVADKNLYFAPEYAILRDL